MNAPVAFTIQNAAEEGSCGLCGRPLYTGDLAYENDDGNLYCCPYCLKQAAVAAKCPHANTGRRAHDHRRFCLDCNQAL